MRGLARGILELFRVYSPRSVGFITSKEPPPPPPAPTIPHSHFPGSHPGLLGYSNDAGDKFPPYVTLARNSVLLLPTPRGEDIEILF